MIFFFLFRNYFIQSFITRVQLVFIRANKFVDPLELNLKKAETRIVPIDKYYKML